MKKKKTKDCKKGYKKREKIEIKKKHKKKWESTIGELFKGMMSHSCNMPNHLRIYGTIDACKRMNDSLPGIHMLNRICDPTDTIPNTYTQLGAIILGLT